MNFVWGFTLKTDFEVDASKLFRRWVSFFPFNVLTFLAQQVTGAVNLRWHCSLYEDPGTDEDEIRSTLRGPAPQLLTWWHRHKGHHFCLQ